MGASVHIVQPLGKHLLLINIQYNEIVNELEAEGNLIFGLHVHVGMENREGQIYRQQHRYFLPHSLHSTNSPFWKGKDDRL